MTENWVGKMTLVLFLCFYQTYVFPKLDREMKTKKYEICYKTALGRFIKYKTLKKSSIGLWR